MSLQGTFDTLSVTELFGLLSTAGKTGALRLEGADLDTAEAPDAASAGALKASVFVADGLCCGVESEAANGSVATEPELASRLVEVGFALARCRSGSFRFADAEHPPFEVVAMTALEPAIAEIESLIEQWHEIESTIPSLDAHVRLAAVLRAGEIILSAAEWSLLVALEGTPTIRELIARRGEPMIDICRSLKDLVDRGAVEISATGSVDVGSTARASAAPSGSTSSDVKAPRSGRRPDGVTGPTPQIEVLEPYAPASSASAAAVEISATADAIAALERADAAAEAEADAVAAGLVNRMTNARRAVPDVFAEGETENAPSVEIVTREPETDEVPQDRGALLRLFSALKEN